MKAYLIKQRLNHWDARPAREKRAILMGMTLLFPLLGYFLLWQPSHEAVRKLQMTLPVLRIQTAQMHTVAGQIEALRHRTQLAVMDAQAVKETVEAAATQYQLRELLTSITVQEPAGVRITLASVSFEKLLLWLRELQTLQHIRIESIALTALPETGMVAVRATLTNGSTP
jgi:type II secretory pathway component PulM